MFKRQPEALGNVLMQYLRLEGYETPLRQRRLLDAWDGIVGPAVAKYTKEKFLRNQVLFVKILNPALRADLSMMQSKLVQKLNEAAGSFIINSIRFY